MKKIVLDTNVLISATFWKGPSYEITILTIKQKIQSFTSIEILEEYGKILKRDFKQTEDEIHKKIKTILLFNKIINPTTKIIAIKEDPDDNKIIEAAIESKAKYIISGDKHLLKLKQFREIKIIKPREFLELILKQNK